MLSHTKKRSAPRRRALPSMQEWRHFNRICEAKTTAEKALRQSPKFTISRYYKGFPVPDREQNAWRKGSLPRSGFPECTEATRTALLEEFLEPTEISQKALARAIRVPPRRVNEVVLGMRAVTADTSPRSARFFGTSEKFWADLQADYD